MRPMLRRHLLLALIFVIGQWLGVVHGTQHELSAGDKPVACEICAIGHVSAGPPQHLAQAASFVTGTEAPRLPPVSAPRRSARYRPPTRGPPISLV